MIKRIMGILYIIVGILVVIDGVSENSLLRIVIGLCFATMGILYLLPVKNKK